MKVPTLGLIIAAELLGLGLYLRFATREEGYDRKVCASLIGRLEDVRRGAGREIPGIPLAEGETAVDLRLGLMALTQQGLENPLDASKPAFVNVSTLAFVPPAHTSCTVFVLREPRTGAPDRVVARQFDRSWVRELDLQ